MLNPTRLFFPLINIRNRKIKSWTHPASPTLEQNQEPPTFAPHHAPTFPTFPPRYPTLPFPPFHFTTSHLSYLATSLASHLSHLPTSPLSHRQIKHSKITTLILLSLPKLFLAEGSRYQNFKASLYSPSRETVSGHCVWSLVCWSLDH